MPKYTRSPKSSKESRITGASAERSQKGGPGDYTPGNEPESEKHPDKKNQEMQRTGNRDLSQGAPDEDIKRSIDEGTENVA